MQLEWTLLSSAVRVIPLLEAVASTSGEAFNPPGRHGFTRVYATQAAVAAASERTVKGEVRTKSVTPTHEQLILSLPALTTGIRVVGDLQTPH